MGTENTDPEVIGVPPADAGSAYTGCHQPSWREASALSAQSPQAVLKLEQPFRVVLEGIGLCTSVLINH